MSQKTRNILIIEDDDILSSIYKKKFEKSGFEVEVASDGQAGFYRIHELRPAVVLLDLMLPQMNGVELLKKIRAQKRFEKLPIFVFTNAFISDYAQEAARSGANQVFNKSTATPQQIIDAVNDAFTGGLDRSASEPEEKTNGAGAGSESSANNAPQNEKASSSSRFATGNSGSRSSSPENGASRDSTSDGSQNDAEFQTELLKSFYEQAPNLISTLRKIFQDVTKSTENSARITALKELYRKVHSIMGSAAITGQKYISQMSAALEALLKELHDKPENMNASTMRTIALAIDFLAWLFQNTTNLEHADASQFSILVVDDEAISRRAVIYALEKAKLKAVGLDEPHKALDLLKENKFDLIILDIEMPEMDGLELCKELRNIPAHKTTPVIFVTGLSDFETRAKSSLSGGNDLIGKPFLFMELAVKAMTYVLRGRLQSSIGPAAKPA